MVRSPSKKFEGRYAGVRELLNSPAMVAEMLRRAEKAKTLAQVIAPKETGAFSESFTARAVPFGSWAVDRAVGTLSSNHPFSFQIETGTKDTPRHNTMRRAMLEGMGD